jgi:hypothetical protein
MISFREIICGNCVLSLFMREHSFAYAAHHTAAYVNLEKAPQERLNLYSWDLRVAKVG